MKKYLIFNADDYGLSMGVSRGIIDSYKRGVVRSTSIMINSPDIKEHLDLLATCPGLDVGLHVNLTFGRPVLSAGLVSSLVDSRGFFMHSVERINRDAVDKQIYKEIKAQFDLACRLGLNISHIDSHHHLHTYNEWVNECMVDLSLKYKLAIRSTEDSFKRDYRRLEIPTPDDFIKSFYGEDILSWEVLYDLVKKSKGRVIEIMCHPGYDDDSLRRRSSYNTARRVEMKILTRQENIDIFNDLGMEIIGYNDILRFL